MKVNVRKSSLIHRRRHGFRSKPKSYIRPLVKLKHRTRLLRRKRKLRAEMSR